MNKRVITISDDLATLVLQRQQERGYPTLDAAAAALISEGLIASADEDHSAGHSVEDLRKARRSRCQRPPGSLGRRFGARRGATPYAARTAT